MENSSAEERYPKYKVKTPTNTFSLQTGLPWHLNQS